MELQWDESLGYGDCPVLPYVLQLRKCKCACEIIMFTRHKCTDNNNSAADAIMTRTSEAKPGVSEWSGIRGLRRVGRDVAPSQYWSTKHCLEKMKFNV